MNEMMLEWTEARKQRERVFRPFDTKTDGFFDGKTRRDKLSRERAG